MDVNHSISLGEIIRTSPVKYVSVSRICEDNHIGFEISFQLFHAVILLLFFPFKILVSIGAATLVQVSNIAFEYPNFSSLRM